MTRPDGRDGRPAPPGDHHPQLARPRRGLGARRVRPHPRALRGQRHRGRAALAQGLRPGLGDRRVRDAAARHAHPQRPRVGQGPHRRPHPRDQPADRPLAARLDRPRGARREQHRHRLRRPAGRRRHPHRGDHRRLRGPRRRRLVAGRPQEARPARPRSSQSVAAVSVGVIDGEPRLDLAYEEDVRGRHRHERRVHRRRRLRRGAGHRGGRGVRPARRSTRCSTSPSPAAPSSPGCRPTRSRDDTRLLLATRNAGKLAELRRLLAERRPRGRGRRPRATSTSTRRRPRPARRSRRTRCSRRARRRGTPGCRRSPTTPG